MSRLKSSAIVLLLALPFCAYAAWQARGLTDLETIVSEPPSDKGLPGIDRLATARSKAEKSSRDIRTVESVAFQFRQPGPGDAVSAEDCKTLMAALAARSAELTDLEKFLSDATTPKYEGSLKSKYVEWHSRKENLAKAARAIDEWFAEAPSGIASPEGAQAAVVSFQKLLSNYTNDGRFYDPSKAASWKVRCRVEIIAALENAAREPFAKVMGLPLPLPGESENEDVKKALSGPRAILEQVRLLKVELNQAEDARRILPARLAADAKEAIGRADEWAAKEELLALFADSEPLEDPSKAGEWLARVVAQFNKTQTESGRNLIRKRVQQFCAAFVPSAARLDATVLIKKEPVPRSGVTIEYDSDAKGKVLTDNPEDLNEFNFKTRYANPDRIVWANGSKLTGTFDVLQPTPKSLAAREFTLARAGVTIWSAKSLATLKMKCEGEAGGVEGKAVRRGLLDDLVGSSAPGTSSRMVWTKENSRIWTRLTVLSEAMEKFPTLFETGL